MGYSDALETLEDEKNHRPEKKYKPVIENGLMWSEIADKLMDWDEAMEYARKLREGDYKDWRLPTVSELQNIYDYEKGKTRIGFDNVGSFWSSSEYSDYPAYAWRVYLVYGSSSYSTKVTGTLFVRCVRRD